MKAESRISLSAQEIISAYLLQHGADLTAIVNQRLDQDLAIELRQAQLLDINSVAKILDSTPKTAREFLQRNNLRPSRLSSQTQRWHWVDLKKLINKKNPNRNSE